MPLNKRIRAAREELTRLGVLVDSGRRLNGQVVWMPNPKLTEEQRKALVEGADDDCEQGVLRLADLHRALEAKFDEICSALSVRGGGDPDPENISDAGAVDRVIEDAETLIDSWNESAENWDLDAKTQRLLAEHREIHEGIARIEEGDPAKR